MPTCNFSFRGLFFTMLLACFYSSASAQLLPGTSAEPATPVAETPKDSLDRRTPRGAVEGFVKAIADQNYIRASQYLQLTKRAYRKDPERIRIVNAFQRMLDQSGDIIPYGFISNKETGRVDDELPEGSDLVGNVTAGGEEISLIVINTAPPGEPVLWQFSGDTVEEILSVATGEKLLVDKILPDVLKERRIGGVPVGHWLAVVVLVLVAYLLSWLIISLISLIIRKVWHKAKKDEKTSHAVKMFEMPFRLYLAVWIFVALSQEVGIAFIVRQRFSIITVTIGIIAFLLLLWRIADIASLYTMNRMTARKRVSAVSIVMFLRRSAKVAIVIFGIIAILGAMGVNVVTGLAALGIGGIALALGAQKTMENFVGSVTLIADQPIRVGDFCKIGDITGTVESIGMRSTKLRTGERTIVTIPNGEFSSSRIENYAHRDRFLFSPTLKFRMDTTPDQIRYLLVELRAVLYAHPHINPDPAKIRFSGFGDDCIKLDVWAYIEAPDFDYYQEVQEDILLRMMDVIAKSGTSLAYPSQTIYMGRDKGISEEGANEVTDTVKRWRKKDEMQLPKFDPKKIDELKGTIPYPPEGSVVKEVEQKDKSKKNKHHEK